MKIHAIRGENMMRMKVFDISFDNKGNTIIVSGKNGEGKSSLLNAIVLGLGGSKTDIAKLTSKPIRDGAKKAWVEVDIDSWDGLGKWTVRRSWSSNDKDTLTILGKDGSKFPSPQKMLDKVLGDLTFDPLAFTRMTPKEQRALLLSIVDIPLDLAAHDAERDALYKERTEMGRRLDSHQGALQTLPSVPEDTPDEELSIMELIEKINESEAIIRERHNCVLKIQSLKDRIKELQSELCKAETEYQQLLDGDPPGPVEVLKNNLANAERINRDVRQKQVNLSVAKSVQEAKQRYDAYTARISAMDTKKVEALSKAEMPIDGLSFDDEGVTFNGIPFAQLSTSQQIKVSTAIGMAQQPELRLMIVKDGSLLDSSNLQALGKMAEANDYQVLVEMVDESHEMGIVIEDGEIVSDSAPTNG